MPYRVNCPTCKTACMIPEDSLGKKLLCGKCRQPFTIGKPKPAASAAPKPPLPAVSKPPLPAVSKAPASRTTTDLPLPSPDKTPPSRKASQIGAAPASPPAPRKKSPLLLVGILAAVVLVLCGGVGTAVVTGIFFLKHRLEAPVAQNVNPSPGTSEASRSNPASAPTPDRTNPPPAGQPAALADQPPSTPTSPPANDGADAKLPPDLDLVPAKEALVLSIQPAKLWKDPALAPLRKLAETNKDMATGLTRLKQGSGLQPADIERAVIIFWGKQASPNSLVLVTTVKPFDRPRILAMIGEQPREEKIGGKSVLRSPTSEFALHLLNEQTFLYGRAPEVEKLLKLSPRAARTQKWNEILRSAPRHALQIAVQHDLFPDDPKKHTPPPLQGLNLLLDAHTAVVTLEAGKELRLTLQMLFNDAEQAKQGERAARQGLELAAVFLGQFAEPFKKSAPGTLPPPLAKLLAIVPDAQAAVKKAIIRTKDGVLTCDAVLASAGWQEALAAGGELFLLSGNHSAPPSRSDKPAPGKAIEPKSPEEAEAALKKLGGDVNRDKFSDGKPIIGVKLVGKQVTDEDLVLLRPLTTLTQLSLIRLQITDKGLIHLSALKELDRLDLGGNDGITDAGLVHLKGLSKLKTLRLLGTRVSDKGVADFKKAHPDVNVVY